MRPDDRQLSRHRLQNWLQMLLLVTGLALLLAVPGWIIAGTVGVVWSLGLVALTVYLTGSMPARLILARAGAGLLRREQAPGLYRILDELYRRAGIRAEPLLFYVPGSGLNAFAVGAAEDGGIAVTDGLLRTLQPGELAGVLAHEISHLRNNDTRVMAMAAAMTQLTVTGATLLQVLLLLMLPWVLAGELRSAWLMLLFVAFAPTVSALLQLALARNREFTADLEAAALIGDGRPLAAALEVLERYHGSWLESLFGRDARRAPPWLQTHPPTRERIRRLLELERTEHRPPGRRQPPLRAPADPVILERPPALGRHYWIRRRR
jgi:heat shock protein HtpX